MSVTKTWCKRTGVSLFVRVFAHVGRGAVDCVGVLTAGHNSVCRLSYVDLPNLRNEPLQ